jgi:hypothetical protein
VQWGCYANKGPLVGPLARLFTADLGSNTAIGKGIL